MAYLGRIPNVMQNHWRFSENKQISIFCIPSWSRVRGIKSMRGYPFFLKRRPRVSMLSLLIFSVIHACVGVLKHEYLVVDICATWISKPLGFYGHQSRALNFFAEILLITFTDWYEYPWTLTDMHGDIDWCFRRLTLYCKERAQDERTDL